MWRKKAADTVRALRRLALVRHSRDFASDAKGGVALTAALALPVLLLAVGVAVDYAVATHERLVLQTAADSTAIAAAKELQNGHLSDARLAEIVKAFATGQLQDHDLNMGSSIAATLTNNNRSVKVTISRQFPSLVLRSESFANIRVNAVATVIGNQKICVIAMDPSSTEAIYMKSNSWLTAQDCNVYSNSKSASGIKSDSGIKLTASLVCSAGGYAGAGQFVARKLVDCPPVTDPLQERAAPVAGACIAQNLSVIDKGSSAKRHVLTPGTYCGGLFIGGNSFVSFSPGTYIIKDGPLIVDSNADVKGQYVGFYLQGPKSKFEFLSNARVVLDAPREGPLTGLLFFEDRSAPLGRDHVIKSNYVSNLTGTIYLSRGTLTVDATNEVAQQSAFTLIVVRKLYLSANPKLVVRSDYRSTDVPVPKGLGPVTGAPVLTQ